MTSLIDVLKQAGFSGQSLDTAYAVAMAESKGNTHAFNGDVSTGDQSYGLFQINMLGGMGPERLKQYGLGSNNDLYDAATNARVAYQMSKGGTDWSPWSTYKRGDYKQYLGQAGSSTTQVDSSPGTTKTGQNAALAAAAGKPDFLGSHIAPGLNAQDGDPFASDQKDPFGSGMQDFSAPAAPGKATTAHNPFGQSSTSMRDKVIAAAMMQLGTPYVYGGGGLNGPTSSSMAHGNYGVSGFDCSSLVMYAYGKNGYSLPRLSWDQLKQGQRTDIANLQPGDLVGFNGGEHIAIYAGDGKVIEAPHTGANVRIRSIDPSENAFGVHLSLPGD